MIRHRPATGHRREVLALAIPAFATLVSEPLLLLADSAIVGHLGTPQLAGLGIAGNLVGLLTGLCVFLAYGSTATVARRLGAGDRHGALSGGIDGIALAVLIGAALTAVLQVALDPIVALYGATGDVAQYATTYLRIVTFAFPFLLVLLASTGVLRGLQDTRTPLKVAVALNLTNIALNVLFVYGLGLGIAGAAWGTLLSQAAASTLLATLVLRGARREGAPMRFRLGGVLASARAGAWLLVRTAALHATLTVTTVVAARMGATSLAAHQVVNSLWMFLAFALDSIAIAAQAIIGRYLGAGDPSAVGGLTAMMVRWGVGFGVVLGLLMAAISPWLGMFFTPDAGVQALVGRVALVVAVLLPLAGLVYVLDGVLIGAGDARYLALAGTVVALVHVPFALWVDAAGAGLVWLWAAYGIAMAGRGLALALRARGTEWQRLGA
ncbi:MAG: MATE family efflux transporter [Propionibacteriaceae bacterium]|nr:MATE family efflux transporter [Propionibacteriaceae bacterium]